MVARGGGDTLAGAAAALHIYPAREHTSSTLQPHTLALRRATLCTLPARGFLGRGPAAAAEPGPAEVQGADTTVDRWNNQAGPLLF